MRRDGACVTARVQPVTEEAVPMRLVIPYKAGQMISLFHEQAVVEHVEHQADGVMLEGRLPPRLVERFKPYIPKTKKAAAKRAG